MEDDANLRICYIFVIVPVTLLIGLYNFLLASLNGMIPKSHVVKDEVDITVDGHTHFLLI